MVQTVPYHIDWIPIRQNPGAFTDIFHAISKKTTHPYNATQKGWSGPTELIRCKLGFCNGATWNGQQNGGTNCSAKQALFCICCGEIKLFHFCLCGSWNFWFCGGTFSKDFQVLLRNLKSLIRILYHFIRVSFHFLSNCLFFYVWHTASSSLCSLLQSFLHLVIFIY